MSQHRITKAKRVTILGAIINTFLAFAKIIGGWLTHSHGLVADGFHSLSDLLTDAMVLVAAHFGGQEADEDHPYGHKRFETAGTLLVSFVLILTGIAIAWGAIDELLAKNEVRPEFYALPIVILSIIVKEWLYQYTVRVGREIKSDLLIANAWHHRSDALSSIVVFFGLIGAFFDLYYLDAVAAFIVAAMIIKMGIDYVWKSMRELVDTATDSQTLLTIESLIDEIDGVLHVHQLRSRHMGDDVFVDVHVQVAPRLSVSEGHYIAQHVHHVLVKKIPHVQDVTVHVDPEDDEASAPSMHLPSRKKLEETFLLPLKQEYPELLFWTLHYLNGKLTIDLAFHQKTSNLNNVYLNILNKIKTMSHIANVRVFTLMNDIENKNHD